MSRITGYVGHFLRSALLTPAPAGDPPPPSGLTRRRFIVAATLLIGAGLSTTTLRTSPGEDDRFYAAAVALAAVWTIGAFAAGPLHLGSAGTGTRRPKQRPVLQPLVIGLLATGAFVLAALAVARAPALRDPVSELLGHARFGALWVVLVITVLNGVAEELFFRGALYDALPRHSALWVTTALYALTTIGSGVPLLVLAAVLLGLVTALQRRATGGILAPIITHVVWSTGMLLLLPPVLDLGR